MSNIFDEIKIIIRKFKSMKDFNERRGRSMKEERKRKIEIIVQCVPPN